MFFRLQNFRGQVVRWSSIRSTYPWHWYSKCDLESESVWPWLSLHLHIFVHKMNGGINSLLSAIKTLAFWNTLYAQAFMSILRMTGFNNDTVLKQIGIVDCCGCGYQIFCCWIRKSLLLSTMYWLILTLKSYYCCFGSCKYKFWSIKENKIMLSP